MPTEWHTERPNTWQHQVQDQVNPAHMKDSRLADPPRAMLVQPAHSGVAQVTPLPETAANALTLAGVAPVKQAMLASSIQTMASGGKVPQFKFFFYAQPAGEEREGAHFLVEVLADTSTKTVNVTVSASSLASLRMMTTWPNYQRTTQASYRVMVT
eukprot:2218019-Pyramimonas_sp.AAC.1